MKITDSDLEETRKALKDLLIFGTGITRYVTGEDGTVRIERVDPESFVLVEED